MARTTASLIRMFSTHLSPEKRIEILKEYLEYDYEIVDSLENLPNVKKNVIYVLSQSQSSSYSLQYRITDYSASDDSLTSSSIQSIHANDCVRDLFPKIFTPQKGDTPEKEHARLCLTFSIFTQKKFPSPWFTYQGNTSKVMPGKKGFTLFHQAVSIQEPEVLEYLLAFETKLMTHISEYRDSPLVKKDSHGFTALAYALSFLKDKSLQEPWSPVTKRSVQIVTLLKNHVELHRKNHNILFINMIEDSFTIADCPLPWKSKFLPYLFSNISSSYASAIDPIQSPSEAMDLIPAPSLPSLLSAPCSSSMSELSFSQTMGPGPLFSSLFPKIKLKNSPVESSDTDTTDDDEDEDEEITVVPAPFPCLSQQAYDASHKRKSENTENDEKKEMKEDIRQKRARHFE